MLFLFGWLVLASLPIMVHPLHFGGVWNVDGPYSVGSSCGWSRQNLIFRIGSLDGLLRPHGHDFILNGSMRWHGQSAVAIFSCGFSWYDVVPPNAKFEFKLWFRTAIYCFCWRLIVTVGEKKNNLHFREIKFRARVENESKAQQREQNQ